MATTTHYLTKTHNRAVVKIVGTAANDTATISLSDLAVSGQVVINPKVTISAFTYSCSSAGHVLVSIGSLFGKFFAHDSLSYGSNQDLDQNINVQFISTAGGTVIIELSKTSGYSAVNPPEVEGDYTESGYSE